jgi:hypothetical protein
VHALSVVIQALEFEPVGPQNQWVDAMFLTLYIHTILLSTFEYKHPYIHTILLSTFEFKHAYIHAILLSTV